MFCPKCGNKLPDDAKFCTKCGTDVSTGVMNNSPKVQPPKYGERNIQNNFNTHSMNNNENKGLSKKKIVCGIFILLVIIGFVASKTAPKEEKHPPKDQVITQEQTTNTKTTAPKIVNLNENTQTNLPQGTEVVLEGIVELGNGKKANRNFSTGFGTANSQAIIFEINNVDIIVFLRTPSDTSLYEKKLKIRGKIDNKITDPIAHKTHESDIIISDAVIIE